MHDMARGIAAMGLAGLLSCPTLAQESSPPPIDALDSTVPFAEDSLGTGQIAALQAWRQGEAVILMRHALAPGTGDPSSFRLGDCSTQRNLSAAGRAQASRLGRFLHQAAESTPVEVYSSQWCRCLDTGQAMDIGAVSELPALNSFFANRGDGMAQTTELRNWIDAYFQSTREHPSGGASSVVLITHQVNITALTGVFPASGEMVFVGSDPIAGTEWVTIDLD